MGESDIRFLVPQLFTGARPLIGSWALILAIDGELERASILLIVGVITDRLDGVAARWLNVTSRFGYRFDCYTDYLFYVVVTNVIAMRLLGPSREAWIALVLGLPLLTGAIRYARNLGWSERESFEERGFPGMPTIIYAFYLVALVFLRREGGLAEGITPFLLGLTVPFFALMMLAPVRYPKLGGKPWFLISAAAGLNVMPFAFTEFLVWVTIVLGSCYVVIPIVSGIRGDKRCPSVSRS